MLTVIEPVETIVMHNLPNLFCTSVQKVIFGTAIKLQSEVLTDGLSIGSMYLVRTYRGFCKVQVDSVTLMNFFVTPAHIKHHELHEVQCCLFFS